MEKLSQLLRANHKFANGCWFTDYRAIAGFSLLASTTNGTSGIGKWQGRKVYFYQRGENFVVEPA